MPEASTSSALPTNGPGHTRSSQTKRWRLSPLLVFGMILAAIGLSSLIADIHFEHTAVHSIGHVMSMSSEHLSGSRRGGSVTIMRPVVKFRAPPHDLELTATAKVTSRGDDIHAGDDIKIAFDPLHPSATVRVDSGVATLDIVMSAVGLAMIGWVLYGMIPPRPRRPTRAPAA